MSLPVKTYSIESFELEIQEAGLPAFRAKQILEWLYGKGADSYEVMTNLPQAMREQLDAAYPLYNPKVVDKRVSIDGSRKYLIQYHDGSLVETVGLPSSDGRLTVCCSSQSGCAFGCVFCATGSAGFNRDLIPGEIVDQVKVVQQDMDKRVTNVVMMGQGEPFANYENTLAAMKIMNHQKLLNIGARHITLSTCGIMSGIRRYSREKQQFELAVSLHSARQGLRDEIMPGVKGQRLDELRKALEEYVQVSGRRFTFEYALMKGINDNEEDREALISYCKGLLCHVNLITLNEVKDSEYKPVSGKMMNAWKESLEKNGIPATIRRSMGSDILAACGQLASTYEQDEMLKIH